MDLATHLASMLERSLEQDILNVCVTEATDSVGPFCRFEVDIGNLQPVFVELTEVEAASTSDDRNKVNLLRHKFYEALASGSIASA